jgi:hypothetical protein
MTRRRAYFAMMGCCVCLVVLAWGLVRPYSVTAAVVMSVAVMVANAGDDSREQAGDQRGRGEDSRER